MAFINQFKISLAERSLERGGVIAYPAEGVWGLGCDPFNRDAVLRLLHIKRRSIEKGLILVGADIEQFSPWLYAINAKQYQHLKAHWPGPYTYLVPDPQCRMPCWLRGQYHSIALRVSAHPSIQALTRDFGIMVSTSANPTAYPAAHTQLKVRQYFADELDFVLAGRLGREVEYAAQVRPSSIIDLQTTQIIR